MMWNQLWRGFLVGFVVAFVFLVPGALLLWALWATTNWERVGQWCQQKILGRLDIWFNGSRYMRRWLFGSKKWYGLRVHCIERSDADRELHDHPFSFVTLIVRGGYWEHTADGQRKWYGPGSILFRSAEVLHRIELGRMPGHLDGWVYAQDKPAWTIVIRGPYRRKWGFLTEQGWINWERFTADREGKGEAAGAYAAPSSI